MQKHNRPCQATMSMTFRRLVFCLAVALTLMLPRPGAAQDFTTDFRIGECTFSTESDNPYLFLEAGLQYILEGREEGDEGQSVTLRVEMTVLDETQDITLDIDGTPTIITTRVVEEREFEDGELVEVSRNFFARCEQTNAVFYFGEDVDDYEDGVIVGHDGAWRAGQDGAQPGVIMPGTFLLGSRYAQEIAPGVAEDRAEHVAMGMTLDVPAGIFVNCVEIRETSGLDPEELSIKRYCAGVGLVFDDGVELIDVIEPTDPTDPTDPIDPTEPVIGDCNSDGIFNGLDLVGAGCD